MYLAPHTRHRSHFELDSETWVFDKTIMVTDQLKMWCLQPLLKVLTFYTGLSVFEEAMSKHGKGNQTVMHCIFVGPPGVGKSSLLKRLLRMKLDPKRTSTQIAEKSVRLDIKYGEIRDVSMSIAQVSSFGWQLMEDPSEQASKLIGQWHTEYTKESTKKTGSAVEDQASIHQKSLSLAAESECTTFGSSGFKILQHSKSMNLLRDALEKHGVSKLHVDNPCTLYLTDSGGQPQFQELLPALVVGPSIFIVVIPLDKDLNSKFDVEYERPDEAKYMQKFTSSLTIEEDLVRSLATIASTKYEDIYGNKVQPRVMFVATFKDKVLWEEDRLRRLKELQDLVKETDVFHDGMVVDSSETQMVFTINNVSADEAEKDAKKIRDAFSKVAKYFKIPIPHSWLFFGILIQHHFAKDSVICRDECLKVAQECGIHEETEFETALQFLHKQTGVLHYYKVPPELNQVVIRDPQHLFSRVNQLVEKTFIFEEIPSIKCCDDFKRGIFKRADYEILTEEFSKSKLSPSMLLKLLEHLKVVVPLDDSETYFMPCAIAHLDEASSSHTKQSDTIPPLLITFKSGYCPKGLFGSLVACIANKKVMNSTLHLDKSQIYRDKICFPMSQYSLCLRFTATCICIEVSCLNMSQSKRCAHCNAIRELIFKNVKNVCEVLQYSLAENTDYFLSFESQCHQCEKIHPVVLQPVLNVNYLKVDFFQCLQSKKVESVQPECYVWLPEVSRQLHG